MIHARETVPVVVLVLAVAVGPGAVLAADDGGAAAGTTEDAGTLFLDGSGLPENSTNATDGTKGAVDDPVETAVAGADEMTGGTDAESTSLDVDDATENATRAIGDATGDAGSIVRERPAGTFDVGGGTHVGIEARVEGPAPVASMDVAVIGDDGSADAGADGDGGGGDRAAGTVSNGPDERAIVPPGPFGREGDLPIAGGAAAAGAGAVGAGALARRTGALQGLRPVARPAASTATALASDLLGRLDDGFWRVVGLTGYQRYAHDDPLEHETRATVYEYLRESPGSHLSEMSEETDVPLSTLRYHLRVLEFENVVRDADIHGKRRYFPVGTDLDELDVALSDDAPTAVLETLARDGPDTVSGLAESLDRNPSTVTHHLQRLESDGLVERERDGRSVVNRVVPAVEAALDSATVEAGPPVGRPGADAD